MKILKKGELHKTMAWFTTCSTCGSELRILEGDPLATKEVCYQCDRRQYFIRYICPVCQSRKVAYTASAFGEKANSEYKKIVLEEDDRKEIDNWPNVIKPTGEDLVWINNRMAP